MARMRRYRLGRLRGQLAERDYAACVLFDPINIRYATGFRNYAIWQMHIPAAYVFVPAERNRSGLLGADIPEPQSAVCHIDNA